MLDIWGLLSSVIKLVVEQASITSTQSIQYLTLFHGHIVPQIIISQIIP